MVYLHGDHTAARTHFKSIWICSTFVYVCVCVCFITCCRRVHVSRDSCKETVEDAVAAEGFSWGVRRQETQHREDMDMLTAVMLVLLAPVSCEGKKIFYLFYLKKMVEMCLFARSQSCGWFLITVKTFNVLKKIFEQDLETSILLFFYPFNKGLSVFPHLFSLKKLNYLNVTSPQQQLYWDSSLLLPTELFDWWRCKTKFSHNPGK